MNLEFLLFDYESHLWTRSGVEKLQSQWGSWHLCLAFTPACLLFFHWCRLYISLQRMQSYCCSIMSVLGVNVGVLLMYATLCPWEWHIRQRDSNCTWKTKSGVAWSLSFVLLRLHGCIVAILPRIIASSYECEIVWVTARWGRKIKTNGEEPALTPFAGRFVYSTCWCLCQSALFKWDPRPYFVSPVSP